MRTCRHRGTWMVVLLLAMGAGHSAAQAVVDRTPNVDDGWTVPAGQLQFNFLHRFEASPPPARKVTSFPNFRLAGGLPLGVNAAVDYATNSTVFTGIPNEYQLSLRRAMFRQSGNVPLDVAVTAAYNFASQSVDGELHAGRRLGPVHLLGTVRGLSSGYDVQEAVWGVGAGAVVRLTSWLSLAGDVFDLVNAPDAVGGVAAWGAGAQLRIPYTPHSLSIQVTNTQSASMEGSSRGVRGVHMAGFEFTIPITLSRYFGHRHPPPAPPPGVVVVDTTARVSGGDTAVTVVRIVNLAFPGEIRVRAGSRVRWVNGDQLQHSVTAADGSFNSGLLDPGAVFERIFDKPGSYVYRCMPHPFMGGRVIVTP